MGSPNSEQGRRGDEVLHNVKLSTFSISKAPVSQKDYQDVMRNNPSVKININGPVDNVSWHDAVKFCNELSVREKLTPVYVYNDKTVIWNDSANGYRLLTEAEWEYACKTGDADFFGAVEWCWDWYGEYDLNNPTDPKGPNEGMLNQKVVRGLFNSETSKNPSARFYFDSSGKTEKLGFRIARSVK